MAELYFPHKLNDSQTCQFPNQRERGKEEWSLVTRSAKPGADILISNLSPATWYQIRVKSNSFQMSQYIIQVTGTRALAQFPELPQPPSSFEFEIATLATDGSGLSGVKVPLPFWPRLCHREGGEVLWEHYRQQDRNQPGDVCSSML